jgi:hypothetical protein
VQREKPTPEAATNYREPMTAQPTVHHRVRTPTAWVLTVLMALLVPLTITSTWALRTVTNTDRYVATMAPLIADPAVQTTLATVTTNDLFNAVDVEGKIADHLPGASKALAPILTAQLRTTVTGVVRNVISSPAFQKIWNLENRATHAIALSVLSNSKATGTAGAVQVKLQQLIVEVIAALDAKGITFFDPIVIAISQLNKNGVVLMTTQQLHTAQTIFHLAITLKATLPWATLALLAAAIAIAPNRRRGLVRLCGAILLGLTVFAGALAFGRHTFVNAVGSNGAAFATAVWRILLRNLILDLRIAAIVAALIGFGAWVAGGSSAAGWIRSQAKRFGAASMAQGTHALDEAAARGWATKAAERHAMITTIVVGIGAIVVLFASSPALIITTVIVVVVALAVLHGLLLRAAR